MRLLWTCVTDEVSLCGIDCNFNDDEYHHDYGLFEFTDRGDYIDIPCLLDYVYPYKKVKKGYMRVDKTTGKYEILKERTDYTLPPGLPMTYTVGDKTIESNYGRTLFCKDKSGNLIWKFTHWAYLYTKIAEKDGYIYFSTGGMGARFYRLNLETGEKYYEIKAFDTPSYAIAGFEKEQNKVALFTAKNEITLFGKDNADILDKYKISREFVFPRFLKIVGDRLYACVMDKQGRPTLLCFDI